MSRTFTILTEPAHRCKGGVRWEVSALAVDGCSGLLAQVGPRLLAVADAAVARGAFDCRGEGAGGLEVEGVEVDLGEARGRSRRTCGSSTARARRRGRRVMMPSLRAATAMRVWQRQSIEWIAAVFAAEPMAMPRSMSRRLHTGPANSSSPDSLRSAAGGVEELGACRVAAGAAVVVRWIPVGLESDEQDRVDRLGDVGVAEPDPLATFGATATEPRRDLAAGFAVADDHRLHEVVLALEEQLSAGLRRGDRRGGHQLGGLDDRVGAEAVVVDVLDVMIAPAPSTLTCCAHQA